MKGFLFGLLVTSFMTSAAGPTAICRGVSDPISASALAPQLNDQQKVIKILTDPVLWRKDFPSVLATLNNWKHSGESNVAVFNDAAVGSRKFSVAGTEALSEVGELHLLMNERKPELKPGVEAAVRNAWDEPWTTVSPVGQPGRDDELLRVVLTSKNNLPPELLAPGLTIATVRERSGEPDSVTTEAIDDGTERRPVILTVYHYAGDAIEFAVSDRAKTPGLIDRAVLNTAKVTAALFKLN